MSTGYGWEGIRHVCAMLFGARHVHELSASVAAVSTWGAITSARPFTFFRSSHSSRSRTATEWDNFIPQWIPRCNEQYRMECIWRIRHAVLQDYYLEPIGIPCQSSYGTTAGSLRYGGPVGSYFWRWIRLTVCPCNVRMPASAYSRV